MFIAEARRIRGGWLCRDGKGKELWEEFFLTQTQFIEELKKYEEKPVGEVIRTDEQINEDLRAMIKRMQEFTKAFKHKLEQENNE